MGPAQLATSLTDTPELRAFWHKVATDASVFRSFRRNPVCRRIMETVDVQEGADYARHALDHGLARGDLFDDFRRNDLVGEPLVHAYPDVGRFAPTTLRFVKILCDLERMFGSLEGRSIIEIGAGYGGQCRILRARCSLAAYAIIDLPECASMAGRYLRSFGIDDVAFCVPGDAPPERADLVISNYAISELGRVHQDRYIEGVLGQATRGYMISNTNRLGAATRALTGHAPWSNEELADRIPGARIESNAPWATPRERRLGDVLIWWNRSVAGPESGRSEVENSTW